jgi:hypothetical protein
MALRQSILGNGSTVEVGCYWVSVVRKIRSRELQPALSYISLKSIMNFDKYNMFQGD